MIVESCFFLRLRWHPLRKSANPAAPRHLKLCNKTKASHSSWRSDAVRSFRQQTQSNWLTSTWVSACDFPGTFQVTATRFRSLCSTHIISNIYEVWLDKETPWEAGVGSPRTVSEYKGGKKLPIWKPLLLWVKFSSRAKDGLLCYQNILLSWQPHGSRVWSIHCR